MQVLQPRYCRNNIGLGYAAFARHYLRYHFCFLFLRVLRCFSSPRSPSLRNTCKQVGCPIRTLTAQHSLATPRKFSQLGTSFIASQNLGIPRAPLNTFVVFLLNIASFTLLQTKTFYTIHLIVKELFMD